MIKYLPLIFLSSVLSSPAGATEYSARGYLSAKASRYTTENTNSHSGQNHRAQLEQEFRVNPELIFVNQLRWKYNSLYTDLSNQSPADAKDTHKIFPGDNYLLYKSSSWVIQTGYQEVAWGEAFGFNYADIVNPKDLKETFYSDYSESRIPLFLANFKYFFNDGSLQLIYSPEPKFSDSLPVNLFTRNVLQQTTITTKKEHSPDFFEQHEYGGKISKSFLGIDASVFYYNYLDRDANYIIENASPTAILLRENHSRINSTGLSVATSILENYVFRTDVVMTKKKRINSITASGLESTPVDVVNVLVSVDTPTYNKFSGVFVVAASRLDQELVNAFRETDETFGIAKLSYDFGEEKIFDLSYTHEFSQTGHGVQGLMTWPVTDSLDLRAGAEMYWGNERATLSKIKNVSNIFFGIKNYFQL